MLKEENDKTFALLTDLSHNTYKSYEKNPDDENRLFYVGATRTKENLHIVQPKDEYKAYPMEDMMSTYDKQIGGSHYQNFKIQPSKFVIENELLYPEGCVIKYILRHRLKGKRQDLEKAIHFIEMIIETRLFKEKRFFRRS